MNVPYGEAYQSAMPKNAFIVSSDMQGRSYSNINLYTGVKKWLDNHMITPLKLYFDHNLKYVSTIVSVSDHTHSMLENSCRA